jgi:cobalamin biosynthesis Mg chelatase CobN
MDQHERVSTFDDNTKLNTIGSYEEDFETNSNNTQATGPKKQKTKMSILVMLIVCLLIVLIMVGKKYLRNIRSMEEIHE